ncbi:MAG: NAD-dependent epimerase/dehydratase family protein, partial [Gemmatimonadota bacterium]|nr:NAD-dependent epimerase/dehydratase family protein [Gemmatimonadota bacterium]
MKALVTGAGGFLGGAIARALKDRGDEVRGFSRGEHPELAAYGIEQ